MGPNDSSGMDNGYAVVDVETTGLSPGQRHRVIEVAVVAWEDGRVTADEEADLRLVAALLGELAGGAR